MPPTERLALLTPSEQRIAEAAAREERNREIACTQFVTIKTVELRLGKSFRELGIRSRTELGGILGLPDDAPSTSDAPRAD